MVGPGSNESEGAFPLQKSSRGSDSASTNVLCPDGPAPLSAPREAPSLEPLFC